METLLPSVFPRSPATGTELRYKVEVESVVGAHRAAAGYLADADHDENNVRCLDPAGL